MASQRAALQRRIEGDYTRCGTPLAYAGLLKLRPEILADLGEQKKPDEETPPT